MHLKTGKMRTRRMGSGGMLGPRWYVSKVTEPRVEEIEHFVAFLSEVILVTPVADLYVTMILARMAVHDPIRMRREKLRRVNGSVWGRSWQKLLEREISCCRRPMPIVDSVKSSTRLLEDSTHMRSNAPTDTCDLVSHRRTP
jgi:hypothetical protein